MIDYYVFNSKEHMDREWEGFKKRIQAFWNWEQSELEVQYKPHQARRSRNQNSLYWEWMGVMAEYFSQKMTQFSKEDMHDLMRHTHLGYEDRRVGNTLLEHQLISTTSLTRAQMAEYMTAVDAWCADKGLLLPIPKINEYSRYKEART